MTISGEERELLLCPSCKGIFRAGFARCPTDGSELGPMTQDPFEGQVFAGKYQIEQFVGQGAMGRVYRAMHTRMPKKFAVKIMFGDLALDPVMLARFNTEAKAACLLDHPNVVSVVDRGDTVGGQVYMVMDFVEGRSLASLLEPGPMQELRARALLAQICLGLEHAHEKGLVHRDLKADNVVVVQAADGAEIPKIIDFGIALLAEGSAGRAKLTAVGVVIGTPAYMSPEQACGEPLDHRSDLFSLGILAYEMVAGKKPFDGHPFEIAQQNVTATPPSIFERSGIHVDPGLEDIIFKLMAKAPADRFQSARAVFEALEALGSAEASLERSLVGSARPPSSPRLKALSNTAEVTLAEERPAPPSRGPRRLAIAIGAAALLLVVGIWAGVDRSGATAVDPKPVDRQSDMALAATADPPASHAPETAEPSPIANPSQAPSASPSPAAANDDEEEEKGRPRRPGTAPRRPGGSKIQIREEEPSPPAAHDVAASEVWKKYREVAEQVNDLSSKRGERAAQAYTRRFTSLGTPTEAVGDPARRARYYEALTKLSSDLRRVGGR
ncbi:MAG: protein kinase [Myxococcota bacterium]